MKKILALIVICAMLMTMLASCDLIDKIKDLLNPPEPPVCTEHVDADGDEKCDDCGASVSKPQPPACTEHKDEDGDEKCDACGAAVPKPKPPACTEHDWGDWTVTTPAQCDKPGVETRACSVCKETETRSIPTIPHKNEDGDYDCDACGTALLEDISFSLDIAQFATGKCDENEISGVFTLLAGSEVRDRSREFGGVAYTKSIKFGSSADKVKISVPGNGVLTIIVENGSSSGHDTQ